MKLFTQRLVLLFVFSFAGLSAKALTAHFTADYVSGCAPLVVHFTNTTTGASGSATYTWDLGNGVTSYFTDASGSYTDTGTYTVTLTVHDGSAVSTYTMTIRVYPPPTVRFTADDTVVCPGSIVHFTNTTIPGVAGAVTYAWSFGDGGYSTLTSPSHGYTSSGAYNVTLTATNAQGCQATLTKVAYIHVMNPPVPGFTSSGTYFCHIPAHVDFSSTSSGTGPFTYSWSFGDGGTSTLANPGHNYTASGSYTVRLTVTDANGCTDSLVMPAYIYIGLLNARFTGPTSACVYSTVTFTNTSSAHTSSEWYYGDGGYDYTEDGTHTYAAAGTYTVTLVVSEGGCNDTIRHTITILPGPTGSFTINPLHACPPPVSQTFTATVPAGTTVTWTYGDSYSGSGLTSSHTYTSRGIYTACMIAVDGTTGCRDTICKQDTLYDIEPHLVDSNDNGCVPLTVRFGLSLITNVPTRHAYPYGVTSYTWNFGDGSATASGATPLHTYTAAGVYHAYVTGITANGCVVTDTVTIRVGTPPVVTFTASPTHACYHNNRITFTTTVISGPVSWYQWYFGDGSGIDSTGTITHGYSLPGVFTVTVIPYYNGCRGNPVVMTNYITIDSPKAIIADSFYCSPGNRVKFVDRSLGDDSHLWMFGDGTTDTASVVTHNYPALSTYVVTLATYNSRSGCRDTTSVDIDLRKPIPNFVADDTTICKDQVVHFTPSVTGGIASSYYWYVNGLYIGDLAHVDPGTAVLTDTFFTRGLYTIRLIISDQHGCFDTLTKNNYVTVAKPTATFTVAPPSGCWPLSVVFTDHSTDVAGVTLTRYEWAYGDGTYSTVTSTSVSHTFYAGGAYTTQEIVTDNLGCRDTVSLPLVTVYRPTAVFYATNTHPCLGDSIVFNNTSTGISGSYWKFGDGDTSTLRSPGHRYRTSGTYTDTLVVTDSHGCKDTAVYASYIVVTKPDASFYMDDSFSICPPLTVHFTNTSTGGVSNFWTLGDGSSSSMTNPTGLYLAIGYDTVKLIVTNSYGCTDTAIGHVSIYGYAGGFTYAPLTGCAPLTVNFHALVFNVPSLTWDFADGSTSATAFVDSTSHVYTRPGKYIPKLILSDNTGCQSSSIGVDTIKVDAVRPGFTTIPNPICEAGTVQFQDTSGSYFSTVDAWHWVFTNGDTSSSNAPSYTYSAVGTYSVTLTVTDGWGCTGMMVGNVNVYPPAQIWACPDTTICVSDAATLIGYGGVSYVWGAPGTVSCTNCNPAYASPTTITTYTVTGIDEHGCSGWDTVTVFLKDKTISVARGDTEICQTDIVQIYDSGATKFTWVPAAGLNNPHIADPLASPDATTRYMVIAQLGSCVPDTNYVTIIVHPLPVVDAGPDQTLLEGSLAQLQATGWNIAAYEWTNASTLSCDSCSNPIASMLLTTTYFVTVSSSFGCKATDSVTIHLYCDKSQIFMPNSFTPNNDGQNDVFYPRGKGIAAIKSFRIYNRWGQMLFERNGIEINDASNAWDGSYNGSSPKPDVYVYIVEAVCETGAPIFIKGDVTIIR